VSDGAPNGLQLPDRRDAAVRAIARAWRARTAGRAARDGDRRTLVACSGGADSSALLIALCAAAGRTDNLVAAHIVHDLRPEAESHADRARARALADGLGVQFVEDGVQIASRPGNAEGNARRARYDALASLADARHCPYVATAHHADDQLETLVMALVRGSGVRGMRGVAPARWLRRPEGDAGVRLVRPMLGVTRADAERLCREAGWSWAEDRTNRDRARLRSAVRAEVLPALRSLRPAAALRAADTAARMRQAAAALAEGSEVLLRDADHAPGRCRWHRDALRRAPRAVVGDALRLAAARLGEGGLDRLPARSLDAAVSFIRSASGEARSFVWSRVVLEITRGAVTLSLRSDPSTSDPLSEEPPTDGQADSDG